MKISESNQMQEIHLGIINTHLEADLFHISIGVAYVNCVARSIANAIQTFIGINFSDQFWTC